MIDRMSVTRKRIGNDGLIVFTDEGVGGIVPNHGPRKRKLMISRARDGWRLHLSLESLRTWDGYRNFTFDVAFHPSKRRRERLQNEYTR